MVGPVVTEEKEGPGARNGSSSSVFLRPLPSRSSDPRPLRAPETSILRRLGARGEEEAFEESSSLDENEGEGMVESASLVFLQRRSFGKVGGDLRAVSGEAKLSCQMMGKGKKSEGGVDGGRLDKVEAGEEKRSSLELEEVIDGVAPRGRDCDGVCS